MPVGFRESEGRDTLPTAKHWEVVASFVRTRGHYRNFIPGISVLALSVTFLLHKGKPSCWGDEQNAAFSSFKNALVQDGVLHLPNLNSRFVVEADASGMGD